MISLSVFLVDEYLESTVSSLSNDELLELRPMLLNICSNVFENVAENPQKTNGASGENENMKSSPRPSLNHILTTIHCFILSLVEECN